MLRKDNIPHLLSIDALRGISALMVLIAHTVMLPKLAIPNYLNIINTHFGLVCPFLFALSGFILSYVSRDSLNNKDAIYHFYVRRTFRIVPLFYFMLIVWIAVGYLKLGSSFSLSDILLNISFTYGFVPGKQESIVWAGWTLGIEMIFYLLFPLLSFLIKGRVIGLMVWLFLCFISRLTYDAFDHLGLSMYAYMNALTHLPYFISGMIAYRFLEKDQFTYSILAILMMTILFRLSTGFNLFFAMGRNNWGLIFMIIILSACYWPNAFLTNRLMTHIGKISYSTYLLHPLIILFFMFSGFYEFIIKISGSNLFCFLISVITTVTMVILIATVTYQCIEYPGMQLGKWLLRRKQLKFQTQMEIA